MTVTWPQRWQSALHLQAEQIVCTLKDRVITRKDIYTHRAII